MKGIKDLENLDSFVPVNPLEHDDTIECLQDYNSLQASEESTVYFVYQKEVLKWKCTHCFSASNNNKIG